MKEGETYTIPKGYHDGTGTVSGVAGGGSYSLQSKTVTPTKKPQQITPDEGYYGPVRPDGAGHPEAYQDVTAVPPPRPTCWPPRSLWTAPAPCAPAPWPQRRPDPDAGHRHHLLHDSGGLPQRQRQGVHHAGEQDRHPHQVPAGPSSPPAARCSPPSRWNLSPKTTSPPPTPPPRRPSAVRQDRLRRRQQDHRHHGGQRSMAATLDGLTVTSKVIPAGYTSGGTVVAGRHHRRSPGRHLRGRAHECTD